MTHTYTQLIYHLVWSTKNREPTILPVFQEQLYQYIGGTFRKMGATCLEIGGIADHIHILAGIPQTVAIATLIRDAKTSSTKWLCQNVRQSQRFAWQEGYGAFSVSHNHIDPVTQYIKNQAEHHKTITFREDFLTLLRKNGVKFDEKYRHGSE
jgi:putative transposase